MSVGIRPVIRTFWICALVFLLDRVTKVLAAGLEDPVVLIPGVLGLRYTQNTGIAFSLFAGAPFLLGVGTIVLMTVFLLLLCRLNLRRRTWVCVMITLGGALGNAADRLLHGAVPDMIEILAFRWGIFNIADIFVVVGILLLMLSILTHPEEWSRRHDGTNGTNGTDGTDGEEN